ncbi:MAG: DUF922 domain-containing protein, partial [Planctomycetes bacterium]|nr:DUF922 domain-containing protein [Planctomycetota bacterium]
MTGVILCLCTLGPAAEVTETFYDVSGKTLAEVWKDIEEKGPHDGDGKTWPGKATPSLVSDCAVQATVTSGPHDPCPGGRMWTVTLTATFTWAVETEILLPRWTNRDRACPAAQREWDRFIAGLRAHETGHHDEAKKALEAAKPRAGATSGASDCSQDIAGSQASVGIEGPFQAESDRLLAAIDAAADPYDERTEHGAKQGAVLDTSIECPPAGDANGDGDIDIGDAIYLLDHLFASGPAPLSAPDVNGDLAL